MAHRVFLCVSRETNDFGTTRMEFGLFLSTSSLHRLALRKNTVHPFTILVLLNTGNMTRFRFLSYKNSGDIGI